MCGSDVKLYIELEKLLSAVGALQERYLPREFDKRDAHVKRRILLSIGI